MIAAERGSPVVPALLKIDEAAEYLRIGQTKLYALMKARRIRRVKIGRSTRIRRSALDAYIERHTEKELRLAEESGP